MRHYKGKRGAYSRRIWKMLREIVLKRADKKCELCGNENNLQVDHCFSSDQSVRLRYEVKNLTCLCSVCHMKKTYCDDGYEKRVDDLVKKREGKKTWEWLMIKSNESETWSILDLEQLEFNIKEVMEK